MSRRLSPTTQRLCRRQLGLLRLSALALSAGFASAAFGCGACDEDKVAATYDHAPCRPRRPRFQFVVSASKERPDAVVADLQRRVNVPGMQLRVVRVVQ